MARASADGLGNGGHGTVWAAADGLGNGARNMVGAATGGVNNGACGMAASSMPAFRICPTRSVRRGNGGRTGAVYGEDRTGGGPNMICRGGLG
jgi:hypothetical protein